MYELGTKAYDEKYRALGSMQGLGRYPTLENVYNTLTEMDSVFIRDYFIKDSDDPDAEWILVWEKRQPKFTEGI